MTKKKVKTMDDGKPTEEQPKQEEPGKPNDGKCPTCGRDQVKS